MTELMGRASRSTCEQEWKPFFSPSNCQARARVDSFLASRDCVVPSHLWCEVDPTIMRAKTSDNCETLVSETQAN